MNEQPLTSDEDDWLLDDSEDEKPESLAETQKPWKLLIVDDEKDVHTATCLALRNVRYKGQSIIFLSAFSGGKDWKL